MLKRAVYEQVTCDRRSRVESGIATECSACDRHGLKCTFTWTPKRKPAQQQRTAAKNDNPYGIPGLTRATLHACVLAYMRYAAPCMPILDIGALVLRVEEMQDDAQDVLVLATACMGACLLATPAVISAEEKFKLQSVMEKRFRELLLDARLASQKESLDDRLLMLEATYVMSDLLTAHRPPEDPLLLDALSSDAIIKLAREAGLHREPIRDPVTNIPHDALTGQPLTEAQVRRMSRVFWSCFLQDTFRSFGRRSSPMIGEDSYDTELPAWMLNPENDFDAPKHIHLQKQQLRRPPQQQGKASSTAAFDSTHLQFMLRLAFIVRTISIKFVTPKAQGRGVAAVDVARAKTSFCAWRNELPFETTWEVVTATLHSRNDNEAVTLEEEEEEEVARRKSIKALFLECLVHRQIIGTWSALCEYGPQQGQEGAAPSLDELVLASFFRMSKISSEAARWGLLRAQRGVLMDLSATFAIWGCALLQHMPHLAVLPSQLVYLGPLALEGILVITAEDVLQRVAMLAEAVATCDSSSDAHEISTRLREFLAETRTILQQKQTSLEAGPMGAAAAPCPISRDAHETMKGMQRHLRQYTTSYGTKNSTAATTYYCFSVPERDIENDPWLMYVASAQQQLAMHKSGGGGGESSPSPEEELLAVAQGPDPQRWAMEAWNGMVML